MQLGQPAVAPRAAASSHRTSLSSPAAGLRTGCESTHLPGSSSEDGSGGGEAEEGQVTGDESCTSSDSLSDHVAWDPSALLSVPTHRKTARDRLFHGDPISAVACTLVERMRVDLAQLQKSTDLRRRTNTSLALSAARHIRSAARMSEAIVSEVRGGTRSGDSPTSPPLAGFFFVPMATAPLPTLRLYNPQSKRRSQNATAPGKHPVTTAAPPGDSVRDMRPEWNASTLLSAGEPRVRRAPPPQPSSPPRRTPPPPPGETTPVAVRRRCSGGLLSPPQRKSSRIVSPEYDNVADGIQSAAEEPTPGCAWRGGTAARHSISERRSCTPNGSIFRPPTLGEGGPVPWPDRVGGGGTWVSPNKNEVRCERSPDAVVRNQGRAVSHGLRQPFVGSPLTHAVGDPSAVLSHSEVYVRWHLERFNIVSCGNAHSIAVRDDDRWCPGRPAEGVAAALVPPVVQVVDDPLMNGTALLLIADLVKEGVAHVSAHCPPGGSELPPFSPLIVAALPLSTQPRRGAARLSDVTNNFVRAMHILQQLSTSHCERIPALTYARIPPEYLLWSPKEVVRTGNIAPVVQLLSILISSFVIPLYGPLLPSRPYFLPLVSGRASKHEGLLQVEMVELEGGVSKFLLESGLLPDPQEYSLPRDDDFIASPIAAPFVPLRRGAAASRRTPLETIMLPSVLPYLTNGTVLCDAVRHLTGVDVPTHRNPRISAHCIANIRAAQQELMHYSPAHFRSTYFVDPLPIFYGDKIFLLLLLGDIMRFAASASRGFSKVERNEWISRTSTSLSTSIIDEEPLRHRRFNRLSPASPQGNSDVRSFGPAAPRYAWPGSTLAGKTQRSDPSISAVYSEQRGTDPQLHRANPSTAEGTNGEFECARPCNPPSFCINSPPHAAVRQMRDWAKRGEGGEIGPHHRDDNESEPDAEGPHATASPGAHSSPASSLSRNWHQKMLEGDKQSERLADKTVPASAPGAGDARKNACSVGNSGEVTYSSLGGTQADSHTIRACEVWLGAALGHSFHYVSPDGSVEVRGRAVSLSTPCVIFSDGVVLSALLHALEHHRVEALSGVHPAPRTTAAKRNNLKRCLEFIRSTRHVLEDAVFLEDALLQGDRESVILLIQTLRRLYRFRMAT